MIDLLDKLAKAGMKIKMRYEDTVRQGQDVGIYTVEIDNISREGATLKEALVNALTALNQKTLKSITAENALVSALSAVL